MENSKKLTFDEIWAKLNSNQKNYVIERQNSKTKADTARAIGLNPKTIYGWPNYVEEAASRLIDHRKDAIAQGLEEAAMQAIMRLPHLVDSEDENIAMKAVKYAIDQAKGKATQTQEVKQQQIDDININIKE